LDQTPTPQSAVAAPLLAIDSASEQAGLALFDGVTCTELSWHAGRSQTTAVLAEIQHLLALNGLEPGNLGAIAVTIGPGTFNGLRVGLSVAKGLVLGLDVPLIGVPTLAAAALPFARLGLTVAPLVPAGRGRIVWGMYSPGQEGWTEIAPPRNGIVADLMAALPDGESTVVTGELSEAQIEMLRQDDRVILPSPALRQRRPAAVATIAWNRLQRGDSDDPVSLQPFYAGRDQG
jgi:tRNA threonylcarbamoyladenosine biosynthesis protein TsaB